MYLLQQTGLIILLTVALLDVSLWAQPKPGAKKPGTPRPPPVTRPGTNKRSDPAEAIKRLEEIRAAEGLKPENEALVGTWQGSDRFGKQARVVIAAEGASLSVDVVLADAQGKTERTGKGTKMLAISGFTRTTLEMDPKAHGPVRATFKIEEGKLDCSIIDGFNRFDAKLSRVGVDGKVERDAVAPAKTDNPDFTEIASFPTRKQQMRGLVADISPDGNRVAMGAADPVNELVVYDMATQNEERRLKMLGPVCSVRWSADGKSLVVASATRDPHLEQGPGREVKLFDASTWEVRFEAEQTNHPVSVSLSHDARTLAVASFVDSGQVGHLNVWDTQTKKELLHERTPWSYTNMALTPKGDTLVVGMLSGEPRLVAFDLPSGKQRPGIWKIGEFVNHVAITPDGRSLAGVGAKGHVLLWDLATSKQTRTFDGFTGRSHTGALLAGSKYLAIGGAKPELQIYENRTGKLLHEFQPSKPDGIYHVAASADGSLLLTYGRDNAVRVWKTPLGQTSPTAGGK